MSKDRCGFCSEEYPVPSMARFCEERHKIFLTGISNIRPGARIGLSELKGFVGSEITNRIEKAVLGTLCSTLQPVTKGKRKGFLKGRMWWDNPNLQDIPVLISWGVSPRLLEHVEMVERGKEMSYDSRGPHKTRVRLRLEGLSSEPKKFIAKLLK